MSFALACFLSCGGEIQKTKWLQAKEAKDQKKRQEEQEAKELKEQYYTDIIIGANCNTRLYRFLIRHFERLELFLTTKNVPVWRELYIYKHYPQNYYNDRRLRTRKKTS